MNFQVLLEIFFKSLLMSRQHHEREVDMLSIKQQDVAEQLKIEMNERILEEKLNTDSAMKQVSENG